MNATKPQTAQFKEMIRQEWTDAATVAAWRNWTTNGGFHLRHATEILMDLARVRPGMQALDLASGTR